MPLCPVPANHTIGPVGAQVKAVFLFILGTSILAGADRDRQPCPEPQFALELPSLRGFPPRYVVLGCGRGMTFLSGPSLRRAASADPNQTQPTALKLEYAVEGALVRITGSAVFGDPQATPGRLHNARSEPVGTYSGALDQSITLGEMERLGLEPLTLKIVSAKPPVSTRPRTLSKAPSLQIEVVGEDRVSWDLAVRNLSAKRVTAFSLVMPSANGPVRRVVGHRPGGIIAPGETYRYRFGYSHTGRFVNGKYVADPLPTLLVLRAALFQDGSYEGDPASAAPMVARRMGVRVQRERIDRLVGEVMDDPAAGDDAARMARIRSAVDKLPEDPDPRMTEELRSRFPGLPEEVESVLDPAIRRGLADAKQSLVLQLQGIERLQKAGHGLTLAQWWERWRQAR